MRTKTCLICWKSHTNSMSKCCWPACERKHRANLKKIADAKVKVKKEKAKTKKALSRSALIKEADRLWSMAIRERDRGKPCITCEQKWKDQCKRDAEYHIRNKFPEWDETHQAWHFMSRRYLNTRWLLANWAGQCPKCNCWWAGEQYEFALALEEKSPWLPESIRRLALSTDKTTDEEILSYIRWLYNDLSDMAVDFKPKKIYLWTQD